MTMNDTPCMASRDFNRWDAEGTKEAARMDAINDIAEDLRDDYRIEPIEFHAGDSTPYLWQITKIGDGYGDEDQGWAATETAAESAARHALEKRLLREAEAIYEGWCERRPNITYPFIEE